jgi:hypothetical protein
VNQQIQMLYANVTAHPLQWFLGYWLFSNVVLYLPPPDEKSGKVYKTVFGVLHAAAGAVPRIASNFLPPGSWIYKLLAGGNGSPAENPQAAPAKVDAAPPKG